MKMTMRKTILAIAAVAAMGVNTAASAEELFQDFTVDANLGGKNAIFTADKITGNYTEIIDFFANGTFQVSLYWEAAAFVQNDGQNSLNAKTTGLGANYGLYALYTADGTFTMQGAATSFNFTAGSGSLNVFLDPNLDTNYVSVNKSDFVASGTNGDIRLAAGSPLSGNGVLDTSLPTCGPGKGILCGGFGSTTTFNLTQDGSLFFTAPTPFYPLSFQSGQLNNFSTTGRQVINGSLDVVFDVPEPSSVALLGLGLFGLGLSRRRSKKA